MTSGWTGTTEIADLDRALDLLWAEYERTLDVAYAHDEERQQATDRMSMAAAARDRAFARAKLWKGAMDTLLGHPIEGSAVMVKLEKGGT